MARTAASALLLLMMVMTGGRVVTAAHPTTAGLSPADFLITSLPGLQTPPTFKHYAGYMPAGSDSGGTSLFFWFVESQRDPQRDPVFLWMNGGPGSSSIAYGFWTEHGPWRLVNQSGSVYPVPYDYSWNRIANVLYIEAPSGVGYSYSNDSAHYHTNDPQTSEDNYQFLLNWFSVFTAFRANDFYITGESYGGHYVPTLAERVLDGSATNGINMKGFVIGNPGIQSDWYYNVDEYAFLTFLWSHALVPQKEYLDTYQACGWKDFFSDCARDFTNTTAECKAAYKLAWAYVPQTWDPYNIYAPTCHPSSEEGKAGQRRVHEYTPALKAIQERFGVQTSYDPCLNDWTPLYMNRADVQKAIHVDSHLNAWPWPNHPPNWQYGSEMDDISLLFPKFFAQAPQWRILVFSGDADAAVPFLGTQRWMICQNRPVKKPWRNWFLNKDVAGVAMDWDRFTFMTIKGCGHTVPTYCPEAGFVFLDKWMTGDY